MGISMHYATVFLENQTRDKRRRTGEDLNAMSHCSVKESNMKDRMRRRRRARRSRTKRIGNDLRINAEGRARTKRARRLLHTFSDCFTTKINPDGMRRRMRRRGREDGKGQSAYSYCCIAKNVCRGGAVEQDERRRGRRTGEDLNVSLTDLNPFSSYFIKKNNAEEGGGEQGGQERI